MKWGGDPRSFPGCTYTPLLTHPFIRSFVGYPLLFRLTTCCFLSSLGLLNLSTPHALRYISRNKSTTTNRKTFFTVLTERKSKLATAKPTSQLSPKSESIRRVDSRPFSSTCSSGLWTRRLLLSLYAVQKTRAPLAGIDDGAPQVNESFARHIACRSTAEQDLSHRFSPRLRGFPDGSDSSLTTNGKLKLASGR